MDALVIASPHLDDAVLSCGQFMAGRPDTTVATVFAGEPEDGTMSTDFDRHSGFSSAHDALRMRRREDANAARLLRSDVEHLHLIDHQYRDRGDEPDVIAATIDAIADELVHVLETHGAHELLAPVGIEHPDHVLVSNAALRLADVYDVWLYEELPNRVLLPDVTARRLTMIESLGHDLAVEFIGEGPIQVKARAVHCYVSQQWALDRRCLFVPERFHRVRPL